MNTYRRLSNVYENSKVIPYDYSSKFVIMSDCHRGSGNSGDNFLKNRNIFFAALNDYYKKGFTYIELSFHLEIQRLGKWFIITDYKILCFE